MAGYITGTSCEYLTVRQKGLESVFEMSGGTNPVEDAPQQFSRTGGNFTVKVLYNEPGVEYYFFTLDFKAPFGTSNEYPEKYTSYVVGSAIDNFGNALDVTWVPNIQDYTVVTNAAADAGGRTYRLRFYSSATTNPTIWKTAGAALGGTITVTTLYFQGNVNRW